MNGILNLGKYLIAIPAAIFGIMHFMAADQMAAMAPGGVFMVYFTGLAHIAAAVAILIGKIDKLAATLWGVMVLLFIIPHIQLMTGGDEGEILNILKNLIMAGGAFIYAHAASRDKSVIG